MAEQIIAARLKEDKKKDKKRKREVPAAGAAAKKSEKGFSLVGEKKDAELEDIFGKSTAYVAPARTTLSAPGPSKRSRAEKADEAIEAKDGKTKRQKKSRLPAAEEESAPVAKAGPTKVAPAPAPAAASAEEDEEMDSDEADDSADDEAVEDLVHETLKSPKKPRQKPSELKFTPLNETPADRDRRSLFLGNLPIEVAKSKSAVSQLKAHILSFAQGAKIESIRFRSVAFAAPTAALPEEEEVAEGKRQKREIERARKWKEEQEVLKEGGKEAEEVDPSKSYLDNKGKRKVAFIKKDFHEDLASCNGYVVFSHPHPDRATNVAPIMDPYLAAEQILAANGSVFQERTIRVDRLRKPSAEGLQSATTALGKRDAWLPSGTDPKRSLFVGGLDYAAKEEDVRVFFEGLVKAERGAREGGGRWVTEVRLIRDRETQMGKGFGYVHFVDRESADEIVALPSTKLKFAKRPLRVQTSKTLPTSVTAPKKALPGASASASSSSSKPTPKPRPVGPIKVPKGDPLLGEKLKDLSKEDRKVAKAADTDRAARRLAKKQSKAASRSNETGAVKLGPTKSERKDRAGGAGKAKKSRVRSSNALANMKGSRT